MSNKLVPSSRLSSSELLTCWNQFLISTDYAFIPSYRVQPSCLLCPTVFFFLLTITSSQQQGSANKRVHKVLCGKTSPASPSFWTTSLSRGLSAAESAIVWRVRPPRKNTSMGRFCSNQAYQNSFASPGFTALFEAMTSPTCWLWWSTCTGGRFGSGSRHRSKACISSGAEFSTLLRPSLPSGHRTRYPPGPVGGGRITHLVFGEYSEPADAPTDFDSVEDFQNYVNQTIVGFKLYITIHSDQLTWSLGQEERRRQLCKRGLQTLLLWSQPV